MRRLLSGLCAAAALAGCRGGVSADAPIHIVQDMWQQPKYIPEAESAFFADGRTMRTPPAGTVARGELREDDAFYRGKIDGKYVEQAPVKFDSALVERGRGRFTIYCTPCHGQTGDGHGIVVQRGYPVAADLTDPRLQKMPDGQIFETVTQGLRNMPSHAAQVSEADRWAIIAWLRVLQRSQHARVEDVPASERDRIEPEGNGP